MAGRAVDRSFDVSYVYTIHIYICVCVYKETGGYDNLKFNSWVRKPFGILGNMLGQSFLTAVAP